MITDILSVLGAGVLLAYSLAMYLAGRELRADHKDWSRKRVAAYALAEGLAMFRDWIMDLVVWVARLGGRAAKRHGPRAARRASIHAKGARAAVSRWRMRRADRRRKAALRQQQASDSQVSHPAPASPQPPPGRDPQPGDPYWQNAARNVDNSPAGDTPPPPSIGGGYMPSPEMTQLCHVLTSASFEEDTELLSFARQGAIDFQALTEAWMAVADHTEGDTGLDVAFIAALVEVAEVIGQVAPVVALALRKFYAMYGGIKRAIGEADVVMPIDGRFLTGEDADGGAFPGPPRDADAA